MNGKLLEILGKRLKQGTNKALDVLESAMRDSEPANRISAARAWLELAITIGDPSPDTEPLPTNMNGWAYHPGGDHD